MFFKKNVNNCLALINYSPWYNLIVAIDVFEMYTSTQTYKKKKKLTWQANVIYLEEAINILNILIEKLKSLLDERYYITNFWHVHMIYVTLNCILNLKAGKNDK